MNKDRHHIVPRSRGGRGQRQKNIAIVDYNLHHDVYHRLFGNKTPDEIIVYLVEEWWNGQSGWVNKALLLMKMKRGVK